MPRDCGRTVASRIHQKELLPVSMPSWAGVILRRFSGHSSHFNVPGRGRALVYSSELKVLALESLRHRRSKDPGPLGSELRKDIGKAHQSW